MINILAKHRTDEVNSSHVLCVESRVEDFNVCLNCVVKIWTDIELLKIVLLEWIK